MSRPGAHVVVCGCDGCLRTTDLFEQWAVCTLQACRRQSMPALPPTGNVHESFICHLLLRRGMFAGRSLLGIPLLHPYSWPVRAWIAFMLAVDVTYTGECDWKATASRCLAAWVAGLPRPQRA